MAVSSMRASAKTQDTKTSGFDLLKSNPSSLIVPLISIGVVVMLTPLVLVPQLNEIIELRREVEQKESTLTDLTEKRTFLEGLDETTLQSDLDLAEKVLPKKKPVFNVIAALGQLVEKSELTLPSYDFTPGLLATESGKVGSVESDPGELAFLTVDYEVKGPFESIYTLMTLLETAAPLAAVKEISIDGMIVPESPDELSGTLTMQMFFSLPPVFRAKPEDPIKKMNARDQETLNEIAQFEEYELDMSNIPALDQQREDLFNY